jgi:hypothetical protein
VVVVKTKPDFSGLPSKCHHGLGQRHDMLSVVLAGLCKPHHQWYPAAPFSGRRYPNYKARPTFFVKDAAHTRFIEAMAAALNKDVSVLECGDSSNVKSLYSLSQSGGWQNSYLPAAT